MPASQSSIESNISSFTPTSTSGEQQQQQQQPMMNTNNLNNSNEGKSTMLVVDPVSRKLNVPVECITETLARFRQGTPSLCMLHLNNRCRQGPNCHQVHADPNVVLTLRAQAQQSLMCCQTHGDRAPVEPRIQEAYDVMFAGGSGASIPLSRIAMTQGLTRFIDEYEQTHGKASAPTNGGAKIHLCPSVSTICRLHGQDRCRFNEECKFVHLCKELLWPEVSASGASNPQGRRYSNGSSVGSGVAPPSPYHNEGSCMPPSPTASLYGYASGNNGSHMQLHRPQHQQQQQQQHQVGGMNGSFRGGYNTPSPMNAGSSWNLPNTFFNNNNNKRVSLVSHESLVSMDLTATPSSSTPTSPSLNVGVTSPVIKHQPDGDSWSYEPYGFNPISMMPPAMQQSSE